MGKHSKARLVLLSVLETLDKIVTQEKRLGYRNKAVIGGLDKFASTWGQEALAQAQTPDQKQFVAEVVAQLTSYPAVEDRQERAKIVGDILAKVDEFQREKGQDRPQRETRAEEGPPKLSGKEETPQPVKPRARPEPAKGRRNFPGRKKPPSL